MKIIFPFLLLFLLAGCGSACRAELTALKDAFAGKFLVGAALNEATFTESNTVEAALVKKQFNCISPENALKWSALHPEPGVYDFSAADRYVQFGETNKMFIIGHNLIWHEQTPAWVFQDDHGRELRATNAADRSLLLRRMQDHIFTVVGRYRGKIGGWDVVNEALADDGTLRESPWLRILGSDYIRQAFNFAHEADPKAQLNYNDYGLENPAKRAGAIKLIRQLQSQGVPIFAVGLQGHYGLETPPTNEVNDAIVAFARLGVKVMISELDVDVLPSAWDQSNADVSKNFALEKKLNPYPNELPPEIQIQLADRYADLCKVFLAHDDVITRVTFWGVEDGDSWLNNWPVPGRTDYPLLFDRQCQPKPAFYSVLATVTNWMQSRVTAANPDQASKSMSVAKQDLDAR